jgi:hypothetical protein
MGEGQIPVKPRVWGMLFVVGSFILLMIYGTIFVASRDPLWFLSGFYELPSRVVVYHEGQQTEYISGQPGFDLLAESLRDSLDQGIARQSGIGFSESTFQDAYKKYLTVEAFFDQPVKLHAWFDTGSPTQMLIPITGRHSEQSVVLLGNKGMYMVNSPALKNLQPLREALTALGYQ